jgi:hypothetical protein
MKMKMKKLISLFFLLAATVGCGSAHATLYAFSYHFDDGNIVSGTFQGDGHGHSTYDFYADNITNIALIFNGTPIPGKFQAYGEIVPETGGPTLGTAIVTKIPFTSNFYFVNESPIGDPNAGFSISRNSYLVFIGFRTSTEFANEVLIDEYDTGYHWRVSEAPEPSTYAMLLVGLTLMGTWARRRSQVV